jgi:putative sugar O-methyltransferase
MRPPTDEDLLRVMLADAAAQPPQYQPGPYWRRTARAAAAQIAQLGLADFRGESSSIGVSFTDAPYVDLRHVLTTGLRRPIGAALRHLPGVRRLFDIQVAITRGHAAEARRLRSLVVARHPDTPRLLDTYTLPPSLLGGCLDTVTIDGHEIATSYLILLHQLDHVAQTIDLTQVRTVLEIGSGFGANLHLLLANYPNLRKVVALDIPPNLYVSTQYLKAHYGAAVRDYRATRAARPIRVAPDDAREILCLAPWQIEQLDTPIDLLWNAHSFQEMPAAVVANYAQQVARLPQGDRTAIALLAYDNYDPATRLAPEALPAFFPDRTLTRSTFRVLDDSHGVVAYLSGAHQSVRYVHENTKPDPACTLPASAENAPAANSVNTSRDVAGSA